MQYSNTLTYVLIFNSTINLDNLTVDQCPTDTTQRSNTPTPSQPTSAHARLT